ncbi:hypothetical protein J7K41_00325 [Candidatus Micrarchaeota archaeon]|nr:hypothetical protein [Candidatus Micrarchaeota archaeon]
MSKKTKTTKGKKVSKKSKAGSKKTKSKKTGKKAKEKRKRIRPEIKESVTELKENLYAQLSSEEDKEEKELLILQTVSYELAAIKLAIEQLTKRLQSLNESIEKLREEKTNE